MLPKLYTFLFKNRTPQAIAAETELLAKRRALFATWLAVTCVRQHLESIMFRMS